MSEHTPGPWDSHKSDEVMAGDWDKHIATAWNNNTIEPDEATANARLISAAPCLLAACEKALAVFGNEILSDRMAIEQAERFEAILILTAAIAKAKGGAA